jgi:RNA polymerase sigma factor (sigma-70 family)
MARRRCSRPIYTGRVPPNWSARDWHEEMRAEAIAAAWEAQCDFDSASGVPLEAFIHLRVLARSLSRFRRECAYASRCEILLEGQEFNGATVDVFGSAEASESLRCCLTRLPEQERALVVSIFWEERTEAEIAQMLRLTQSAISRRKRRILGQLRRSMDRPENDKKP